MAPTMDPAAPRAFTQIARLLEDALREPLPLYWIAITDYLRAGLGRALKTLRHALADPVLAKLPLLACPVLVVRGERDPIVPLHWVEMIARLIPSAGLIVIPQATHAVNFNSPEALIAEVLKFLGQKK